MWPVSVAHAADILRFLQMRQGVRRRHRQGQLVTERCAFEVFSLFVILKGGDQRKVVAWRRMNEGGRVPRAALPLWLRPGEPEPM